MEPKLNTMKHTFDPESYHQILNAIFKRFPSVQTASFKDAYKPGLAGMEHFDAELGHPHTKFKTVHVAGTNGKGSVCNMLASALMECGYKVGLYTSPHLIDFRERMRVNGKMIPAEAVYDFFMDWKDRFDELDLSFFEITTGLAFHWFAEEKVDVAIIETGLGGRLDSTNIITPELSVITSIGLDHCGMLGNTLAEIAGEKAGIIKTGVPVVIGEVVDETRPVFVQKAEETHSPLHFSTEREPRLWNRKDEMIDPDQVGSFQEINLRTVLTALEVLSEKGWALYSPEEKEKAGGKSSQIIAGIRQTRFQTGFHGRWEFLCDDPHVLCDIGHNAHGLKHNFEQLDQMMARGQFTSLTFVFGMMADKDLDAILPMMPEKADYVFTQADTARALDCKVLAGRFIAAHPQHGRIFDIPSVKEAVEKALDLTATDRIPLIYIGGSNFVVSEAFPLFHETE